MSLKKVFILVLFMAALYACNKMSDDNLDNQTDSFSVKEPSDYDLKIKKINIITDHSNNFSKEAFKTYQEYVNTFGNDPKSFKSGNILNFSKINDYHIRLLRVLDSAIAIPVFKELDPLIRSYKINARAFAVTINSCASYYSKKEYKNDGFDKGDVLHKLTLDIYSKFDKANNDLMLKSKWQFQKLEDEYLSTLKKNGFEIKYLSILGKKEAEKLNSVLIRSKYNDLNIGELERLNDTLSKIHNRLSNLKDASNSKFNNKSKIFYLDFEEFFNASNALYKRKKEKKAFTKKEIKKLNKSEFSARSVVGSANAVTFAYKKLIISFKDVRQGQVYINPKIANTKAETANSIKKASAIQ